MPRTSRTAPVRDGAGRSRRRSGRWAIRLLAGLLLLWLAACWLVVAEPTSNRPARVDAILVLGPADIDGRLDTGLALARAHYAATVVVSVPRYGQDRAKAACAAGLPGVEVRCFEPRPATTRGEGREIGELVAAHHWTSVLVVTSKYHVSRARMIIGRCLPGMKLLVTAAPGRLSARTWAYQFLYQSAGYVKAFAHPGC